MKEYAIVANGHFLVKEIITEATINKMIIALDGAVTKLIGLHIKPQVVLGDFDSILPSLPKLDQLVIHAENQEHTDLMKAIQYCDQQQAKSITLLCALGGRIDHHEAAIRSLRTYYQKDRPIYLHTEQQTLRYVKNETLSIKGEVGDKCGVLAFPSGVFSSQGLAYDVVNYELNMGFSESISNSLEATEARISVTGEALIIMPPQLAAQRAFMQKTEFERLELLLRDAASYRL